MKAIQQRRNALSEHVLRHEGRVCRDEKVGYGQGRVGAVHPGCWMKPNDVFTTKENVHATMIEPFQLL